MLDVAGIGDDHTDPACLGDFVEGNPVHPVDSMATVSIRQATSQSARRCRLPVKLRKVRTASASHSGGTATTWNWAPTSIPAAPGSTVDSGSARRLFLDGIGFMAWLSTVETGSGAGTARSITFLFGIAKRHHHTQTRNSPRATFFCGVGATKKQTASALEGAPKSMPKGVCAPKGAGRAPGEGFFRIVTSPRSSRVGIHNR
jgi:hypothetical protein